MKRLQIMIEEELDVALEHRAQQEGVSKAALIRRFVRQELSPPDPAADPLWDMVGADDFEPDDDLDGVVYR